MVQKCQVYITKMNVATKVATSVLDKVALPGALVDILKEASN